MTYIGVILIMGASLFVGVMISRRYTYRTRLLSLVYELARVLKNNLSFRKDNLELVIGEYIQGLPADMKKPINILKEIALNGLDEKNINSSSFYCLKKEEKNMIFNFFKNLGQSNECVESCNIEGFSAQIEKMYEESASIMKKNKPLAIKLSVAVGLVVSILII